LLIPIALVRRSQILKNKNSWPAGRIWPAPHVLGVTPHMMGGILYYYYLFTIIYYYYYLLLLIYYLLLPHDITLLVLATFLRY